MQYDKSRTKSTKRPTRSRATGTTPSRTCYAPGETLLNSPAQNFHMQSQSFSPNAGFYGVPSPFQDGNDENEDDSMLSSPNLGPSFDYSQLFIPVQEQQSMLRTIISSQELLKKGQDELKQHQRNTDERLFELEEKMACSSETSSGSSSTEKKKRIGKDLSVRHVDTAYIIIYY